MIEQIHCSGIMDIRVFRDGQVIHEETRRNLITNAGIDTTSFALLATGTQTFYTYTDTTPNYDDLNGTYSQSGTTLTRVSGTGVFASGDVGKEVKFGTGERCHITAFGSTTSVTVSRSQAIVATTLRRYYTTFASTTGFSQQQGSTISSTTDLAAGTITTAHTVTFASATSAYTLGSISANTSARVVLAAPVSIAVGDQVQLIYTVQVTLGSRAARTVPLSSVVAGWPYQYGVASISGSGSVVTVTTSEAHNFAVGDTITVLNSIPQRKTISSISSTATTWTVAATGHGLSAGDSIVHESIGVAAYNGTWVVSTVTDANTYTVTNASNPGAAAGGTTRKATPATYFSGDYTVAGVPNTTSITASSTITGPAVDTTTRVSGKDECTVNFHGLMFQQANSSSAIRQSFAEASTVAVPAITLTTAVSGSPVHGNNSVTGNTGTYVAASYTNDWLYTQIIADGDNWGAGGSTASRVKQIYNAMRDYSGNLLQGHLVVLRTPQEKKSAYKLTYPKMSRQLIRDLP